eukprot:TRINITY_DN19518_c0_g1_i1.p1 TRINITY_DN19518_c0_g1~~TRINITY_DN19518_c0_g1_i1.p1  ORF type:complete len:500 (+),score=108.51 TRINITY_DN19518_c0_g1_i1:76-1575(+)
MPAEGARGPEGDWEFGAVWHRAALDIIQQQEGTEHQHTPQQQRWRAPDADRSLPFCADCAGSQRRALRVCCGCGTEVYEPPSVGDSNGGYAPPPPADCTPGSWGEAPAVEPPPGCELLSVDPQEVHQMERAWAATLHSPQPEGPPAPAPHGRCRHCPSPASARPCEWACADCGELFCGGACHASWHQNPLRVNHTPPRPLPGSTASCEAAGAPPKLAPSAQQVGALWGSAAGSPPCQLCDSGGADGAALCASCVVHNWRPQRGTLRLLLRACEVCQRAQQRPALFHSSHTKQAMCPQCWSREHRPLSAADRPVPAFLYGAGTSFLLHQVPAYRPFLRLAVEISPDLPAEPLPPPDDEHPPPYVAAIALARLPVPEPLRPDAYTRSWEDYPQEVIVAAAPRAAARRAQRPLADQQARQTLAALAAGPVALLPPWQGGRTLLRQTAPRGAPVPAAAECDVSLCRASSSSSEWDEVPCPAPHPQHPSGGPPDRECSSAARWR